MILYLINSLIAIFRQVFFKNSEKKIYNKLFEKVSGFWQLGKLGQKHMKNFIDAIIKSYLVCFTQTNQELNNLI